MMKIILSRQPWHPCNSAIYMRHQQRWTRVNECQTDDERTDAHETGLEFKKFLRSISKIEWRWARPFFDATVLFCITFAPLLHSFDVYKRFVHKFDLNYFSFWPTTSLSVPETPPIHVTVFVIAMWKNTLVACTIVRNTCYSVGRLVRRRSGRLDALITTWRR